ncbi:hypothetical protein E2986_13618 [Frieseomelitta varia]|uniref:Uncharacterized protein n=1 Tax=Frieseomelitta varia TaxID=561572 RepID=A0A833S387_9HYME|nr:hypothetical protein E2986_13618 [Frieseomelitta varia]
MRTKGTAAGIVDKIVVRSLTLSVLGSFKAGGELLTLDYSACLNRFLAKWKKKEEANAFAKIALERSSI